MFKKEYFNFVYILANRKKGALYVGMTSNLYVRVLEHKMKINKDCFTARHDVTRLMYYETYQYVNDAIAREKQLKKWRRDWKIELIEKENKEWRDLYEDAG